MDVICKREDEVKEEDAHNVDLVVALGGDHTFLVASQMIKNNKLPILGLNTYQGVIGGALMGNGIDFGRRHHEISSIFKRLSNPAEYEVYKRSRGRMTFFTTNPELNAKTNVFTLNELFCAEKDVGSASRFRISPDGQDWGIFKSSGMIISTGKSPRALRHDIIGD